MFTVKGTVDSFFLIMCLHNPRKNENLNRQRGGRGSDREGERGKEGEGAVGGGEREEE